MSRLRIILIIIISFLSVSLFGQYQFDSTEIKKIRLIIEDNSFLKTENDSLESKINLLDRKVLIFNSQIAMRDTILHFKDIQIKDLEVRPAQDRGAGFITWLSVIITSISAGIVTGILIK